MLTMVQLCGSPKPPGDTPNIIACEESISFCLQDYLGNLAQMKGMLFLAT